MGNKGYYTSDVSTRLNSANQFCLNRMGFASAGWQQLPHLIRRWVHC